MSCCPAILNSFVNESITSIPYTAELRAEYGSNPFVQVVYRNDENAYQVANVGITLSDGNIVVDHGGPMTGLLIIR